jgi:hypothetical protein
MARITRHIRHMHHVPCIECGIIHNNPASSVRCDVCEAAHHAKGLELARAEAQRLGYEAKKADKFSADAHVLINLRTKCGLSMKDADTFLKAFRICMENING